MALLSLPTAVATSPSEASWATLEDCVAPPSTALEKIVYSPAVELRPTGSIVVDRLEPLTDDQLVSTPRKMSATDGMEIVLSALARLTSIVTASRNSWSHVVWPALADGWLVWMANWDRPAWTSLTPALPPSGL